MLRACTILRQLPNAVFRKRLLNISTMSSETPKLTLIYFDARYRAEPSRLLLAAAGVKYEDRRVKFDEWKSGLKATFPWAALPVLEIETKAGKSSLHQSWSIHRYLAATHGFMGSSPLDAAQVDALVEDVLDAGRAWFDIRRGPYTDDEKKEKFAKYYKDDFFGNFMPKFERTLKENGTGWLQGSKVSLADIAFFNLVDVTRVRQGADSFKDKGFALIEAHYQRVASIPGIAAWLKARPFTADPW